MLTSDDGKEPLWQTPTNSLPSATPATAATLALVELDEAKAAGAPAMQFLPIALPRAVEHLHSASAPPDLANGGMTASGRGRVRDL